MQTVDSFKDYLVYERNCSPHTVKAYEADVLELFAYVQAVTGEERTYADIDADLVRDWVVSLMDSGEKASSVNRKLSSVRAFYKFLLRRGLVKIDPLQAVEGPKKSKPLPVFVREEDMDRLLDNDLTFTDDFKGHRDRAIIDTFYMTGIRLAELVGLDDVNVDLEARQLKVRGKRNKERIVPFGAELEQTLRTYLAERNERFPVRSDAFFVNLRNAGRIGRGQVQTLVRRYLSQVVQLKKRSPHVLRHTFATAMMNHGADLNVVRELLGHDDLATTEIYTHVTFEELKRVYNQAHPRA